MRIPGGRKGCPVSSKLHSRTLQSGKPGRALLWAGGASPGPFACGGTGGRGSALVQGEGCLLCLYSRRKHVWTVRRRIWAVRSAAFLSTRGALGGRSTNQRSLFLPRNFLFRKEAPPQRRRTDQTNKSSDTQPNKPSVVSWL